jgi:hypothetical protein
MYVNLLQAGRRIIGAARQNSLALRTGPDRSISSHDVRETR